MIRTALLTAVLALAPTAAVGALPADPLESPMWAFVADQVFGADPVLRFDPRVKVRFPSIAENQREFPVEVDARGIADIVRVILIVDLNPIQLPIDFTPTDAEPFISVRIKLDQRTPVRGAVQLRDGTWLVSGGWVDAAGGGCSMPPVSRVKGDWAQHLGEVRGRLWKAAGETRVMLAFRHPMDTGLVDNIPAYYLETLTLATDAGRTVGTIRFQAAVAEDPVVMLMPRLRPGENLTFAGRDTNGIDYAGKLVENSAIASVRGSGR